MRRGVRCVPIRGEAGAEARNGRRVEPTSIGRAWRLGASASPRTRRRTAETRRFWRARALSRDSPPGPPAARPRRAPRRRSDAARVLFGRRSEASTNSKGPKGARAKNALGRARARSRFGRTKARRRRRRSRSFRSRFRSSLVATTRPPRPSSAATTRRSRRPPKAHASLMSSRRGRRARRDRLVVARRARVRAGVARPRDERPLLPFRRARHGARGLVFQERAVDVARGGAAAAGRAKVEPEREP